MYYTCNTVKRKKPVTSFTIPPELTKQIDSLAEKNSWNRSEAIRHVIEGYFSSPISESDLSSILMTYWRVRGNASGKVILAGVGLIIKEGKVLIGARKKKDKYVEELSWVFPGGALEGLDFEKDIKREMLEEAGLEVDVRSLISARVHPDSGHKSTQVVILYFHCVPAGGKERPGGDLKELKWVRPMDVFKYFTTSVSDEITRFLVSVQKG